MKNGLNLKHVLLSEFFYGIFEHKYGQCQLLQNANELNLFRTGHFKCWVYKYLKQRVVKTVLCIKW